MAIALDGMENTDRIGAIRPRSILARRHGLPFTFTGQAGEYFGIWIVNIMLSIVTLGIYSAWAKVRTKRYFYGNTKLDGSSFNYLASPVQILKGRLIVFVILAAVAIAGWTWPVTILPLAFLMFLIAPWVIVQARAFNARYSSYRNINFGFSGGVAEAFRLYVLWPIVIVITIGGLFPYSRYLIDRFLVDKHRYGQTTMTFTGRLSGYYRIYGVTFLLYLPAILTWALVIFLVIYSNMQAVGLDPALAEQAKELASNQMLELLLPYWMVLLILAAPLSFIAPSYHTVRRQAYLFNNTKIGPHQLRLNLKLRRFLWIRYSNLVVIVLSAGLMIPWAKIRMARYQIEQMSLVTDGDLETTVSDEQTKAGTFGDEMGEGMGLGI